MMQDAAFADMPDLSAPGDDPAHARIEKWLVGLVAGGDLVEGDKLPPEGELSAALGVSRMTLRQALGSLESRGMVARRRGRSGGTFVATPRIDVDLTGLAGFTEQMRRANVRAGAQVVSATTGTAPRAVAAALDISHTAKVHEIVRVRLADNEPLALERTYLPAAPFEDLLSHGLTGSIYALMASAYGQAPHSAFEWLEPVVASAEEGRLLSVEPGSALMLVTRTARTQAGLPVEYAFDRYRADRARIGLQTGIENAARITVAGA